MVLLGLQSKLNRVENIEAHTVRKERFSSEKKRERCIRSMRTREVIILKNPNLNIRSAAGRSPPRHSAFWRKCQGCIQLCPDDLQPHCLLGAQCPPTPPEQLGREYFSISIIIMVSIQVKTYIKKKCVYIYTHTHLKKSILLEIKPEVPNIFNKECLEFRFLVMLQMLMNCSQFYQKHISPLNSINHLMTTLEDHEP